MQVTWRVRSRRQGLPAPAIGLSLESFFPLALVRTLFRGFGRDDRMEAVVPAAIKQQFLPTSSEKKVPRRICPQASRVSMVSQAAMLISFRRPPTAECWPGTGRCGSGWLTMVHRSRPRRDRQGDQGDFCATMVGMSRGPTRRVCKLVALGTIMPHELSLADHQADLLAHPYIGVEHVALARLVRAGMLDQYDTLLQSLKPGVRRRWWRPRGPRSALRRTGIGETMTARRRAQREGR